MSATSGIVVCSCQVPPVSSLHGQGQSSSRENRLASVGDKGGSVPTSDRVGAQWIVRFGARAPDQTAAQRSPTRPGRLTAVHEADPTAAAARTAFQPDCLTLEAT